MIPLFKVFMSDNITKPISKVLLSGYIGQGPKVDEFETKLQKFIHNPFIFTLNSGTSALHLSLRLAGVKHGDDVISTAMTCTATNWAILHAGANIIWADINPDTGNIDPQSIKKNITKKTKAIIAVDWGGYPCDIEAIRKIAPGIPIIEDAAHAFGSIYKNKMVGQTADFTCFSFQAIKHLTTVDGGAVAVKDKKTYDRGVLLRWYGIDRKTKNRTDSRIEIDINEWGYKFHMNDVNATVGIENMNYVRNILKKHRDNATYYKQALKGIKEIKFLKENKNNLSSYWLFTIKVQNRAEFMDFMNKNNVMVSQVHRRNDTHPTVSQFKKPLPGVDAFTKEMVCIPVGWWVTTKDRQYIAEKIKEFFKKYKSHSHVNSSTVKEQVCSECG